MVGHKGILLCFSPLSIYQGFWRRENETSSCQVILGSMKLPVHDNILARVRGYGNCMKTLPLKTIDSIKEMSG